MEEQISNILKTEEVEASVDDPDSIAPDQRLPSSRYQKKTDEEQQRHEQKSYG